MSQLILYDGKKPNYQKAIARSPQSYAAYTVDELTVRSAFPPFHRFLLDEADLISGRRPATTPSLPPSTAPTLPLPRTARRSSSLAFVLFLPSRFASPLSPSPLRSSQTGSSPSSSLLESPQRSLDNPSIVASSSGSKSTRVLTFCLSAGPSYTASRGPDGSPRSTARLSLTSRCVSSLKERVPPSPFSVRFLRFRAFSSLPSSLTRLWCSRLPNQ
jgi:hypothetical protein